MGFKPITRNMPAEEPPNILSEDDAAIYRGILGQDGVLNIGSKLKSTVLSNNKVRVGDGVINVDGHIGRNAYADYEDLTIENGTAGQKRNDLIIASFSTTGSGGLDTYVLKVKKGVAGSTGTDPAVTKQDIYTGGKLREYPLYRVKLDGLSIVGVEQLFKVIPTVPELETKYNELNSAMKNIGKRYSSKTSVIGQYPEGGYINFTGNSSLELGTVIFNRNGTVTIKEAMDAIVNIRLSGSSSAKRLWAQLKNYNTGVALAESIVYGEYFTGNILTCLHIEANTVLAVMTREGITMNTGGLESSMEIIRLN